MWFHFMCFLFPITLVSCVYWCSFISWRITVFHFFWVLFLVAFFSLIFVDRILSHSRAFIVFDLSRFCCCCCCCCCWIIGKNNVITIYFIIPFSYPCIIFITFFIYSENNVWTWVIMSFFISRIMLDTSTFHVDGFRELLSGG